MTDALDGPFRESIAHSGWVGILILSWFKLLKWYIRLFLGPNVCDWTYCIWAVLRSGCITLWGSWLVLVSTSGWLVATGRRWRRRSWMMIRTINTSVIWTKRKALRTLLWCDGSSWIPRWFPMIGRGSSHMTFKKFVAICLIAKPVTLYVYTPVAAEG